MKRFTACMLALLLLAFMLPGALAENDGDCVYSLVDADGKRLTRRAGRMYEGDEYISSDNTLYRVAFVDDERCVATAEKLGRAVRRRSALPADRFCQR